MKDNHLELSVVNNNPSLKLFLSDVSVAVIKKKSKESLDLIVFEANTSYLLGSFISSMNFQQNYKNNPIVVA